MEKNRIRPVHVGKGVRMSYSKQKEVLEMPNLIEVQTDSYKWFLEEGLNEVFRDISPIADYNGNLSLEFVSFELCRDDVKYSIEECKERDATYAAPLKVKVRLHNNETEEISEHDIFMGDLPLMTATGTFIINGAERVIVSQLVRSPGIYYGIGHDKQGYRDQDHDQNDGDNAHNVPERDEVFRVIQMRRDIGNAIDVLERGLHILHE
jgi:DNA-directed RNA polymerase subunit beta